MHLGNGKWESTAFNSRLQPTQIGLGSTLGAANLLKLDYEYGASGSVNNGNITKQTITVPTVGVNTGFTAVQSYEYDSLNWLKDATENVTPHGGSQSQSWRQAFTFDRYGNRNFNESLTTTLPKECNGNTEVCEAIRPIVNPSVNTANNRLNGYTFDAAGNTTVDAEDRGFIYDSENKQTEVRDQYNTVIGQYFYDGDGKRIKKIVPSTGEITVFVYDASGKSIAEYSTVVESVQNAKVAYLTADHLGSPRITTDQVGQVVSRRDFMPFGEEIFSPQRTQSLGYTADTIRQKFTGYERDTETQLDFAEARMYANNFGRFTAVDPMLASGRSANPQTFNRYVYVINNPLTYIDPNGTELIVAVHGVEYRVIREKLTSPLSLIGLDGNSADGKELALLTTMLNRLNDSGGLNTQIDSLIGQGNHRIDVGFVSGDEGPSGYTNPVHTDTGVDSRSGVSLNTTNDAMIDESTIVLGTEIMSSVYLSNQPAAAAYAYGIDEKGNTTNQFNNDPNSVMPGVTTYEQFRAQSSSDLRRTMSINEPGAVLPPVTRPAGTSSSEGTRPSVQLPPVPSGTPPPIRRPQPSENNTRIQRMVRPNQ